MRLLYILLFILLPFSVLSQISLVSSPSPGMNDSTFIDVCPCDTILFTLDGDISNVTSIMWQFNDDLFIPGSESQSFDFCEPGNHSINVIYIVNGNETIQETAYIRVSTTPDFSTLLNMVNYGCQGETILFEGSFVDSENYNGFEMTPSGSENATFVVDDFQDIPDNGTPCYESSFVFEFGNDNAIITSADEVESLFINMNHTYIGDLIITYTCPNGSTVVTHQQGGGTMNLGNDSLGYDYYWNNNDSLSIWQNVGGTEIPSGTYQSLESFENFVGCPVNGEWSLEVCDVLGADLGAVFSWGVSLTLIDSSVFTPVATLAYWQPSPWIIEETDSDITILQEVPLDTFTFVVEDNFGCSYSQDITLTMNENIDLDLVNQIDMNCSYEQLAIEASAIENCSQSNGVYEYCYDNFEEQLWLYCPDDTTNNTMMTVEFNSGFLEVNYDYIYIYDGSSTSDSLIATLNGNIENVSYTASNESGCILVELVTDYSVNCGGNEYDPIIYSVSCGDAENYYWSWEPIENLENPNSPNLIITEITDDFMVFTATITDPNAPGCVLTHDVVINTQNTFDVGLDSETEICITDQEVSLYSFLNGTPSGEGIWLDQNEEQINGFYTPTEVGTFTYYYTSENCNVSSLLTILVSSIPETPTIIVDENFMITGINEAYQWYLNGVLLDGATNQSYTAPVDGNYMVEVFNSAGCSTFSEEIFIGEENTDNINEYQEINFTISPNPFNLSTRITLENSSTYYTVYLYSIAGKLVKKYEQVNASIIIEKENLEAGIYILEVEDTENRFSKKQRLVIE